MNTDNKTDILHKEVGILNLTRSDIKSKIDEAILSLKDGWTDPIDALIYAKKGELFFKELIEKVKPLAENESIGKDFRKFGTEINEAMQGVKYDFSECGDIMLNEMMERKVVLDQDVKDRQDFLKTIKKTIELVDTTSGETYTVKAPIKTGSMGFVVKIK